MTTESGKKKIRWSQEDYKILAIHMVGFIHHKWSSERPTVGIKPEEKITTKLWLEAAIHAQTRLPSNRQRRLTTHQMVPPVLKSLVIQGLQSKIQTEVVEPEVVKNTAPPQPKRSEIEILQSFFVGILVKAAVEIMKTEEFKLLVKGNVATAESILKAKDYADSLEIKGPVAPHQNNSNKTEIEKISVLVVGVRDHDRPALATEFPTMKLKFWAGGETAVLLEKVKTAQLIIVNTLEADSRAINTIKSTQKEPLFAREGVASVRRLLAAVKVRQQ